MRSVPDHIAKPPYAATGTVSRMPEPAVKTPDVIARMRTAGATAAEVLAGTSHHGRRRSHGWLAMAPCGF